MFLFVSIIKPENFPPSSAARKTKSFAYSKLPPPSAWRAISAATFLKVNKRISSRFFIVFVQNVLIYYHIRPIRREL